MKRSHRLSSEHFDRQYSPEGIGIFKFNQYSIFT